MIVWLNGTHGAGKTTTSALVQQLIPDSRVFDAEKVGETLMDITPGLPETDNFQHWPPWRPLVVETARRVLDYTGGTLVMPMTVLVEQYWREISTGLAHHAIPVRHFVLHADQDTLRGRIEGDTVLGPSPFRLKYLEPYAEAARTWLHGEAEVIDTTHLTPAQAAQQIADRSTAEGHAWLSNSGQPELLDRDVQRDPLAPARRRPAGSSRATWTTRPSSSAVHITVNSSTSTLLDLAGVDAGLDDAGDQVAPLLVERGAVLLHLGVTERLRPQVEPEPPVVGDVLRRGQAGSRPGSRSGRAARGVSWSISSTPA